MKALRWIWGALGDLWSNPQPRPEPVYDSELTVIGVTPEDRRTLRAREYPKGVLVSEPFPWSMQVDRVEVPILVLYQAFFNGRKVEMGMEPVGRSVGVFFLKGGHSQRRPPRNDRRFVTTKQDLKLLAAYAAWDEKREHERSGRAAGAIEWAEIAARNDARRPTHAYSIDDPAWAREWSRVELDRRLAAMRETWAKLCEIMRAAFEQIVETVKRALPQLQAFQVAIESGRGDRPAWQSPYGPPRGRRR